MDGFELNKIAGAVLSAMLVMASGRVLLDIMLPHHAPEKPGWALPVTEAKAKTGCCGDKAAEAKVGTTCTGEAKAGTCTGEAKVGGTCPATEAKAN